jgi:hypothetical protein
VVEENACSAITSVRQARSNILREVVDFAKSIEANSRRARCFISEYCLDYIPWLV